MRTYEIKNSSSAWTYQANSKEEAKKEFLHQLGLESYKDYAHLCKINGVNSKLDFKEIVKK